MTDDEVRAKELKLVGKSLYVAEYRRVIFVTTKPYEAGDEDDAQWKAWEAESDHEEENEGLLLSIRDLATGEKVEYQ